MSIFDGIIVTIFADLGPSPLVNSSPLDESIAIKLSIAGMTILTMGYGGDGVFEKRHFRLHGPLPVPDSADFESLAMSFKVKPTQTDDQRVQEYGRECTLFIIFSTKNRSEVLQFHKAIENGVKEVLQTITKETELNESSLVEKITTKLNDITKTSPPVPSEKIPELEIFEEKTLGFFSIDNQGEIVELTSDNPIEEVDILIFANSITKTIFNISMKDSIPQRRLFLAAKAASQINLNKYRSQCIIRDVSDEMERNYILDKVKILTSELGIRK